MSHEPGSCNGKSQCRQQAVLFSLFLIYEHQHNARRLQAAVRERKPDDHHRQGPEIRDAGDDREATRADLTTRRILQDNQLVLQ
jgi:hypothetical protein